MNTSSMSVPEQINLLGQSSAKQIVALGHLAAAMMVLMRRAEGHEVPGIVWKDAVQAVTRYNQLGVQAESILAGQTPEQYHAAALRAYAAAMAAEATAKAKGGAV
jgi:hypothetical protein